MDGTASSSKRKYSTTFDKHTSIYDKSPQPLYHHHSLTTASAATTSKKPFVSAQRRYDNVRVRDSEFDKRLCLECGAVLIGAEKDFQEHLLVHESVNLLYQLDCFERFGAATATTTAVVVKQSGRPKTTAAATIVGPPRRRAEEGRKIIVVPSVDKQHQHVATTSGGGGGRTTTTTTTMTTMPAVR